MQKNPTMPMDDPSVAAAWGVMIQKNNAGNASTISPVSPVTPNSSQHDLRFILDALSATQEKVNTQDDQGNTPLMIACQRGTPTFAQALIEQTDVDLENSERSSPYTAVNFSLC